MGADVSRVRHDPRRNYSGVLQQQGRVVLDADGNEQLAIADRRHRAAAADLGSPGPAPGVRGTAVVPRTTLDAFRLTVTGGVMTIGRGRMYVDGLLAENHGTGATVLDPLLAGPAGAADTPYLDQPWQPSPLPEALPTTGTRLLYLDVWERELTSVEEPDLVDPALAVDTTARTQVVWQVRVHAADVPGLTCATPDAAIPGWQTLTAPSAGRLTVDTIEVDAGDDPCVLPPSGDYRGLENQTYRVEVHDGGAPGTATFKWSRDNASVTLPVTERISANELRLSSLGKDEEVLGLRDGHWVEILDDRSELSQQPGLMRRVTVQRDDMSVSFTPALPAGWPTSTTEAVQRGLRVRRWDQGGLVKNAAGATVADLDATGATGLITVPAAGPAVVLEHGVTVALTAPGGVFRTGDHWEFAARTGDTVEPVTLAPPRGVHHHYARLGVLTAGAVADPDCRVLWPPEQQEAGCGDCTVCVSAEGHNTGDFTIQDAVDQVAQDGGTVCLGAGTFRLEEPVRVEKVRGVEVHGQGGATMVLAAGDGFVVTRSVFVTLRSLVLVSAGGDGTDPDGNPAEAAGVRLAGCWEATLERLTVLVRSDEGKPRGSAVKLHDLVLLSRCRDSFLAGAVCVAGWADPEPPLLLFGFTVAGNTLAGRLRGVALDGLVAHAGDTEVTDNLVIGSAEAGVSLTGVKLPSALLAVDGNEIGVRGHGVVVGTGGVDVTGNTIIGDWDDKRETTDRHGISTGDPVVPVDAGSRLRVADNRVSGFGGHAVLLEATVTDTEVSHNEVTDTAHGIAVTTKARERVVHVGGNVVRDVGARSGPDDTLVSTGIRVAGAQRCSVSDNTVQTVGGFTEAPQRAYGVVLLGVTDGRCVANAVADVGQVVGVGTGTDYAVGGVWGLTFEANRGARRPEDDERDEFQGFGLVMSPREVIGGKGAVLDVGFLQPDKAFYFSAKAFVAHLLHKDRTAGAQAVVTGNTLVGSRFGAIARIQVPGTVVLADNIGTMDSEVDGAAVQVRADAAAVSANRLVGGIPTLRLDIDPKRVTVLGNLTSSGIDPGPLPAFAPLNIDGVF